jgi:hypothetical protein
MPAGCLGKPHGALIPANSIPRSPAKSGRACSRDPLRTDGRNQTRRPNRERRHDGLLTNTLAHFCHRLDFSRSPLIASRTVPSRLRHRTEDLQIGFPARANYRLTRPFLEAFTWASGSLGGGARICSSPQSESCHTCTRLPARLSRSNGTSDPCAPFSSSKTRRDSTFPREVPGGPLALFSRFTFACQARCGMPHLRLVS